MTHGYEVTFKWTWRIVNTMAQVMMEECLEMIRIACTSVIKIVNRLQRIIL